MELRTRSPADADSSKRQSQGFGVEALPALVSIQGVMTWFDRCRSRVVLLCLGAFLQAPSAGLGETAAAAGAPTPQTRSSSTEVPPELAWKNPKALAAGTAVTVVLGTNRWTVRWVPPGRFTMGSPLDEPQRDKDEIQHDVVFTRGFFMAETECTQAQWSAVATNNPSHGKAADQPVNQVTWKDARDHCLRLTQVQRAQGLIPEGWEWDLPTEAQWEYACRAGTTGPFAGDLPDLAWIESNSEGKAHAVKTRKPNAWGLHDLHGNVWEWCRDWYGEYPATTVQDPTGPSAGNFRCYRGGSRIYGARRARSAIRGAMTPELRGDYLGFRAVLLPKP